MTDKKHTLGKAYVDKEEPGVVRFENGVDVFDGLLAGTRAQEVVKRWNAYPDMVEALKAALNQMGYDDAYPETEAKVLARAALAKAGVE